MKKAILTLAILLLSSVSFADEVSISDLFSKLKFDTGIAYSIKGKEFCSISTVKILEYSKIKLDPALSLGYSSSDNFVVGLSASLGSLKSLGVDVPILDLIKFDPFVGYGFGSLNLHDIQGTHNDWFIGIKLIDIKG